MGTWTFARKIVAAFALIVGLSVLVSGTSYLALRALVEEASLMDIEAREMAQAARLEAVVEQEIAAVRGHLLRRDAQSLEELGRLEADAQSRMAALHAAPHSAEGKRLLQVVDDALRAQHAAVEAVAREAAAGPGAVARPGDASDSTAVVALRRAIDEYTAYQERTLAAQQADFQRITSRTNAMVLGLLVVSLLIGGTAAVLLSRGLTRDIGTAVQHVQSSSAELQAAANQQATASREQAAATNETTTTIRELVATARQIAESAQRVSQIAEQTAAAARGGEQTVARAQDALGGIKRQVDLVVTHMLELGQKSQQIGGILEIINELAEQTNILSINATIEAAGAGEVGKRFAAVADEIRKLADRVGGSAKDIRRLIDEIRSAVNTTVMATEQGTKAVDQGARQVGEVAASFTQIAGMVATTTEAAREIELSTKQQTTAVEQVNIAMVNVAQAARETEASSSETLNTAAQLSTLSRDLTRMIQPQA
jgi:methyl-accepting chemotaxis protein